MYALQSFLQRSSAVHAARVWRMWTRLVAILSMFHASEALAQHCHVAPPQSGAGGGEVSLRSEAALFRTVRYEGDYEGIFLRIGWFNRVLALQAALPHYHIVRNGLGTWGFGDLTLEGRAQLARTRDERAEAGALLLFSAPSGDSAHDLGMGHWMLAPTAWASVTRDRFTLEARLGYGRAFGTSAHHRHAPGTSPIVDPMNRSEVEASLSGVARAHRQLSTRVVAYGAAPTSEGVTRAALAFAGDLSIGRGRFSLEAHLPLAGDAFRGKLAAELGFRF